MHIPREGRHYFRRLSPTRRALPPPPHLLPRESGLSLAPHRVGNTYGAGIKLQRGARRARHRPQIIPSGLFVKRGNFKVAA